MGGAELKEQLHTTELKEQLRTEGSGSQDNHRGVEVYYLTEYIEEHLGAEAIPDIGGLGGTAAAAAAAVPALLPPCAVHAIVAVSLACRAHICMRSGVCNSCRLNCLQVWFASCTLAV